MKAPITIRDYLRLLFRRKYALALPIVCSVFLILPMWKIIPEKYRATALVKRKDLALTNAAAGSMMIRDNGPVPVETMRAEILTWTSLERVVKQLKLDVDLKTAADWQDEYEELRKSITIKTAAQGHGVDLIEIAVMDKNAISSQQIANAIADNYVEESQRSSRDDTLRAIDYFKAQCEENIETIRKANLELEKYTREHWTELPEVKRGILTALQGLRTTESEHLLLLSASQTRRDEIDRQVKEVEKTIKNDVETMDNPARQDLQGQLQLRMKRLTEMLRNYTEDHPEVKAMREEIATLQAQLKDTPDRVQGTTHETVNPVYQQLIHDRMAAEQDVKAQEASLRETRAQIMANEASIRKVVDEEKQYGDIQRQHDEAKDAYEQYHKSLLMLQNRSRVQSEPNGTQVEIIARALEPAEPYHGYRLPLALGCVGGALAAGFALVSLLEFVDHSLRGADDAATSLSVPVLATLTEIPTPAQLNPTRGRLRLMLYVAVTMILLSVLTATLIEGFQPGKLGEWYTYLRQLLH